ncbi:MAG TPA: ATP-binding cassette domain-containing protein [Myxococcota bacterium]|nr:ATP-binding cassette domain-containing protein [Myxococcota bacterium]
MSNAIELEGLRKVFRTRERARGFAGALRALVAPRTRELVAVDGVSFQIAPGERVAFVGPNGAGKSTTLKMLSGILRPTAGKVRVAGLEPGRDRHRLGFRIGAVFGQRSQLWTHLPALDTFDLLARIYELAPADYRARRDELVRAFEIDEVSRKPVSQLSLGERMRCELVASLLHRPEILFLDEPTIGLDVVAKAIIRDLVRERGRRDGCTVLLTSHDTGDMERVCERVLVIHRGRLLLDRPVDALRRSFIPRKRISVVSEETEIALDLPGVQRLPSAPHRTELEVDLRAVGVDKVVAAIVARAHVLDLVVEDPPMEEIVSAIYAGAKAAVA